MTSDPFREYVNSLSSSQAGFLDRGYDLPPDIDERIGRLKPIHDDYGSLMHEYGKFFQAESRGFLPGDDSLPPWVRRND